MHLNTEPWYALYVRTGEEDKVKERLQYKFGGSHFRIVVPKRKLKERKNGIWETRIRTLFPGYVLINGSIGNEEYYSLKGTPGLVTILKDKDGPIKVDPYEIQVISHLIYENEIIETSSVFIQGGRIVVADGPLTGLEGLIEAVDKRKGRAKVRLNFIGEARVVELNVAVLESA